MSPKAQVQEVATAHWMAWWLSAIATGSAAIAAINVVRILGRETSPVAVVWLASMIAVTATGIFGAKSRAAAIVWGTSGGVFGFVAIASGSIGVFFAPAALLLLAAGIAASIDERVGWRTLWMPIYLFVGATAMAAVTLLMASLQGSVISRPGFSQQSKLVPPAIVFWGSAAFVVLIVILACRAVTTLFRSGTD